MKKIRAKERSSTSQRHRCKSHVSNDVKIIEYIGKTGERHDKQLDLKRCVKDDAGLCNLLYFSSIFIVHRLQKMYYSRCMIA